MSNTKKYKIDILYKMCYNIRPIKGRVMKKEDLIKLKNRIMSYDKLSEEEKNRVIEEIKSGKEYGFGTGYATIDRPWEKFYEGIIRQDSFNNVTSYEGFVKANKDYPKEEAIEYFGTKVSFGELIDGIDKIAKSLEEYGVKKGDFVTVCSTATPEIVCVFYALSKIGAVINAISPFYTPEELLGRVNECESKLIIIADKFFPKFKDALNKEKNKNVVILPLMNSSILKYFSKKYQIDAKTNEIPWKVFEKDGSQRLEANIDFYEPKKPQAMVYSSGTTGASKGIILSVDSFQKLVNAYGNSGFDTSRKQKVYHNAPPWSSTGLSLGINFPLSYGVKICMDPRFDQDVFVKNILKFKPEYVLSDTSMYHGFTLEKNIKRLRGKSLAFLKYPVEGGEPLSEKDIHNIESIFRSHGSSARLLNGYGQCECGATITTDITSKKFANNASGIPLPDIATVGIFDDDFNELLYGERGNIAVITEIGMLEYYKNKEATEKYFRQDSSESVWSMTGDIGYMNSDGSLVVLGRKTDYSVIDGKKIYNFDIEQSILKSSKVGLCEVQTHPENDNQLVAHIVWNDDAIKEINENQSIMIDYIEEIQRNVLESLGISEAVPYSFCIREKFPTASSGKRDWKSIKNNVEGLLQINKPLIKNYQIRK